MSGGVVSGGGAPGSRSTRCGVASAPCCERGQVLPLLAVLVAGAVVVALLVVARVGSVVSDRAEARTAADAGALAGVVGGDDAARRVVEGNGAVLVELRRVGDELVVHVRVGDAEATSVAACCRPSP